MFSLINRAKMYKRKRRSLIVVGPAAAGKDRNGKMILSKHVSLLTDMRTSNINMNVAVFGNSADNAASYVGPNIMQANGSLVVLDPDGDIYGAYAEYLKNKGYMVKRLDLVHMDQSDHCDVPTDDVVGRGFARLCLLAESQEDDRPRRVNTYPLSPVTGNTCFLTESQDDIFYEAFLRPSFGKAFFFGKASLSSLLLTERMKWRLRLFFPGRGLLPVSRFSDTGRTL